jgi:sucrose-6-phosphate hydrolase SacC (GH32 family)
MDIHVPVPGYESVLNMTATTEPQTVAEESEDLQQKHKHQRHRTSFHYQPAKNWMNGEHPNRNCFMIP